MSIDLADRRQRVEHALANPVFFAEVYVRPFDPNWVEAMPAFGKAMLRFAVTAKKGAIMLPPEFMKTTLVSQVYPLWLTYRAAALGRLLRGMLMSEEEGMAKANLSVLRWHIEENELLRRDFVGEDGGALVRPHPTIQKWSDTELLVARVGVSRDPTWRAKGLDSKGVHGSRLDVFIGDDLVTPRNAHSPALRKSALDTMDLQIETRIVKDGQMLVAGNFNDDKDLLSTLAKRDRWQVFKRPSAHVPGNPEQAPKESDLHDTDKWVPTWPTNWTRDRLMAEYREKPNRFRRIHLLDPRAEHGEKLNTDWVTIISANDVPVRYCKFYVVVDSAPGGETDDLDFCNFTVGALHGAGTHTSHLDVLESIDVRADTPRQVSLLGLLHDRYQRIGQGVAAIAGPKGAIDAYFRGALQVARPDLIPKLEPISAPGNKEIRLEGLGPYAQSGWMRVTDTAWLGLTSDPHDQHQELSMYEQWRDFPFGGHDDRLDGLDVLIRTAQEFAMAGERTWQVRVAED